jgi:hypothetical protein
MQLGYADIAIFIETGMAAFIYSLEVVEYIFGVLSICIDFGNILLKFIYFYICLKFIYTPIMIFLFHIICFV